MKSVTASYWLPLQVQEPNDEVEQYTGYAGQDYEPVEELMSEVISDMEQIYGNIAGMHYVVEKVTDAGENSCTFHLQLVITGIVAGNTDAEDNIHDQWPTDITEWVKVRVEQVENPKIQGYDLNPVMSGPDMTTFHSKW